jgi:flavin-dependent dehydrogenase
MESSDVVVIGGGPAGSTIASFLARKGHAVTVLERATFPRDHVGESLLPFCYRILEELGLLEEMKSRYVRKPGVRFLDTDGVTQTTWCFGSKIHDPSYLSFHVIRSEFDQLLLNHSADEGATVREGTKVESVDLAPTDTDPAGGVRVEAVGPDGKRQTYQARFVVDASGRDTFLANRMKTKTAHKELERTALGSHWTDVEYGGGLSEGLIQIVYTGGEKQGWIWVIPLSTNRVSLGVVMNTAYFREQRGVLKAAGADDWQHALYRQEIMASPFIRQITDGATQMWPVVHNGDYSYTVGSKWGDNYALVGDASAFIDPIFSSGVYLAMNSARLLSDAVDARLTGGSEEGSLALKGVYEKIVGAYSLVDKLIRLFYTPESINFAQLGQAAGAFPDIEHHVNAMSLQHFLLAGDFFEQANRYSDFVDTLADPKLFRRYKQLVIDRPVFQETTCEHGDTAIFPESLAEHDRRRAEMGI